MPAGSQRAYLDHASTSPLRPEAHQALLEWVSSADPGRVHAEGRAARYALEEARQSVADLLGTRPRQVIFTSGATEAIAAATYGAGLDGRVVLAGTEHSTVRESSAKWASEIVTVGVDGDGVIDVQAVKDALASGPVKLVHCQLANHEVGTLQPVSDAVSVCRDRGVMVHVDAAAAAGHVPISFDDLGADLMSVSAHKLGGPRGVGALLVRRGLRVPPLLVGGAQERNRRAGLENVAAAAGFGAAATSLLNGSLENEAAAARAHISRLRESVSAIADVTVLGPAAEERRLPHLLCLILGGVEAEPVLIGLDQSGVAAHSGSSCSSETLEPSPVLEAMGVDSDHSLRLSVGWSTTDADIDRAVDALAKVVERLRSLSV